MKTQTLTGSSRRAAPTAPKQNSIGKKGSRTDDRESILEVTVEDYERMKAQGIDDESLLKPGKHVFRRVSPDRVATREDLHPSNTKVQITIKIDLDILNHFKGRSRGSNAAPYQTQINAELRAAMERDLGTKKADFETAAERLLENDEFLRKLSDRLRESDKLNGKELIAA